jgi:ATP-dependent Clp protease ATP-binding subunit ClpA
MFDSDLLSSQSRHLLCLAHMVAHSCNSTYMSAEHLLIAMGQKPNLPVGVLLNACRFDWRLARARFASAEPELVTTRWLRPKRQLCDAIERATDYSKQMRTAEASPECLLLGILDVQEVQTELLRQMTEVQFAALREVLERRLGVRYPVPFATC